MNEARKTKSYFFCITVCSPRTLAKIAKKVGVVYANSPEEAEELVWEQHGNDASCEPWVEEIPKDGYSFTVYKSEI